MIDFTADQLERYARHIVLQNVGVEGQLKIMAGKVLLIGAGGLGSPIALYLTAAGVGTIGLVDSDKVDLSNLQRQIIHFTNDVGGAKVTSAANKMRDLNPDVKVKTYHELARADTIRDLMADYDFVVDATDNFAAKFLINDACVMAGKPHSHGGILRFEGQTITVVPGKSACYRCVFIEPPPPDTVPAASQAGLLGTTAGMLGTIQAAEVLKFLIGTGDLLLNRLLVFDALTMNFRQVNVGKRADCAVCGDNPTIKELVDGDAVCD